MSRAVSLLFSLIAYAIFFATFLYLIVFVGDLPFGAQTIDRGPDAPLATAVVIDLGLVDVARQPDRDRVHHPGARPPQAPTGERRHRKLPCPQRPLPLREDTK